MPEYRMDVMCSNGRHSAKGNDAIIICSQFSIINSLNKISYLYSQNYQLSCR